MNMRILAVHVVSLLHILILFATVQGQSWYNDHTDFTAFPTELIDEAASGIFSNVGDQVYCTGISDDCLGYLIDNTPLGLSDIVQPNLPLMGPVKIKFVFKIPLQAQTLYFVQTLTFPPNHIKGAGQLALILLDKNGSTTQASYIFETLEGSFRVDCCEGTSTVLGIQAIEIELDLPNELKEIYALPDKDVAYEQIWTQWGPDTNSNVIEPNNAAQHYADKFSKPGGVGLLDSTHTWRGSNGGIQLQIPENNANGVWTMSYLIVINPVFGSDTWVRAKFCSDTSCWNGVPWQIFRIIKNGLVVHQVKHDIWRLFLEEVVANNQEWQLAKFAAFKGRAFSPDCMGDALDNLNLILQSQTIIVDKKTGFIASPASAGLILGPLYYGTDYQCGYVKWAQINPGANDPKVQFLINDNLEPGKYTLRIPSAQDLNNGQDYQFEIELSFYSVLYNVEYIEQEINPIMYQVSDEFGIQITETSIGDLDLWVLDAANIPQFLAQDLIILETKYTGALKNPNPIVTDPNTGQYLCEQDINIQISIQEIVPEINCDTNEISLHVQIQEITAAKQTLQNVKVDVEFFVIDVFLSGQPVSATHTLPPINIYSCQFPENFQNEPTIQQEVKLELVQEQKVSTAVEFNLLNDPIFEANCGYLKIKGWQHNIETFTGPQIIEISPEEDYEIAMDCSQQNCAPGEYQLRAKIQFSNYENEEDSYFLSDPITIKVEELPPPIVMQATAEQLESFDLKTLDPQFLIDSPLEEWLLVMGSLGQYTLPETTTDENGNYPLVQIEKMPGFVVFDGQRTFKIVAQTTDESSVSVYEIKFQLVDSQNRVKEYSIVLKVEVPSELQEDSETNSEYTIPIEEQIEQNQVLSAEKKQTLQILANLDPDLLLDPDIEELVENESEALYVVLEEFGKYKPKSRSKPVIPEIIGSKIERNGLIELTFNTDMIVNESIKKLILKTSQTPSVNQKVRSIKAGLVQPPLEISMISNKDPSNTDQIDLYQNITWDFVAMYPRKLLLNLNFQRPEIVSLSNQNQDQITVKIIYGWLFRSTDGISFNKGEFVEETIPRQVDKETYIAMQESAKSLKESTSVFLAVDTIQGLLVGGSLNYLIGLVDMNMLIMLTTLFETELPLNVEMYFQVLLEIVKFELFQTEEPLEKVLKMDKGDAISDKYEALGFESKYTVFNLGPMICFVLFWVTMLVLNFILNRLVPHLPKLAKKRDQINVWLFWGGTLGYLLGEFIVLTLCFAINYPYMSLDTFGHRFNTLLALLLFAGALLIPMFGLWSIHKAYSRRYRFRSDRLAAKSYAEDRLGILVENVDPKRKTSLIFLAFGYIRAIFLVWVVFGLKGHLVFQFLGLYLQWMVRIIMVTTWKPLKDGLPANNFLVFEETIILLVGHHLLWIAVLNSFSQTAASLCGYSLISISLLHLAWVLISHFVEDIRHTCRKGKVKYQVYKVQSEERQLKSAKKALQRMDKQIGELTQQVEKVKLQPQPIKDPYPESSDSSQISDKSSFSQKKRSQKLIIQSVPKVITESNNDEKVGKLLIVAEKDESQYSQVNKIPSPLDDDILHEKSQIVQYFSEDSSEKSTYKNPSTKSQTKTSHSVVSQTTGTVNLNAARSAQEMSALLIRGPTPHIRETRQNIGYELRNQLIIPFHASLDHSNIKKEEEEKNINQLIEPSRRQNGKSRQQKRQAFFRESISSNQNLLIRNQNESVNTSFPEENEDSIEQVEQENKVEIIKKRGKLKSLDLTRFESSPRVSGKEQQSFEANFMDQEQIQNNQNTTIILGLDENEKLFNHPQQVDNQQTNFEHMFNVGLNLDYEGKEKKIPLKRLNFKKISPENLDSTNRP